MHIQLEQVEKVRVLRLERCRGDDLLLVYQRCFRKLRFGWRVAGVEVRVDHENEHHLVAFASEDVSSGKG